MNIRLITINHRVPSWVTQGFTDYQQRLASAHPLELIEIPLQKRQKNSDNRKQREAESEKMLAAIPPKAYTIALDEKGKNFNSEQQAAHLTRARSSKPLINKGV